MITCEEFLNKIKWDPKEKIEDYSLCYFDRVSVKLDEIMLKDVEIKDGLIKAIIDEKKVSIPLHRVRIIRKKGKNVWQRPNI